MRRTRKLVGVGVTLFLLAAPATVRAEGGDDAPPTQTTTPATSTPTTVTLTIPVTDAPTTEANTEAPSTERSTEAPSTEAPSSEAATSAPDTEADTSVPAVTDAPTPAQPDNSDATTSSTDDPTTTTGQMCDDTGCKPGTVPDDGTVMTLDPAPTTTTKPTNTQDQQTVVTGTQVAGANTGGNLTVTDQPGAVTAQDPGTAIDTGNVDAIGSQDVNTVTQGADVTLTGSAVANLLQIALILNFGAAAANSGANAALSADGTSVGGDVSTGNSQAVGNQIASYVTQAANANANSALNDSASQQALSLFLGMAVANSGVNSVTGNGVAGSGGDIASGSAQAIGNDSVTNITQWAKLMGADDAVINVLQRATVLNLGFALANSGLNDISGVAGSLLSATDEQDDQLAEQLFAMLLPALLSSYGYGGAPGGGAGAIGTGGAQAIGNQSYTGVLQTVGAQASGNGVVDVSQDVLVANEGGALANTGLNTLGGIKTLDPQTATAVVKMAAFLSAVLSRVHHSTDTGDKLAAESQGIDIPFGDFILHLDATMAGLDTSFTSGGAQANVRQITVVISFGMASANSGRNVAATLSDTSVLTVLNAVLPTLLAAEPQANSIATGDAVAVNHTLVQICQKINADDVQCLAPPPPPPPADNPDVPTTTVTPPPVTTVTPVSTDPVQPLIVAPFTRQPDIVSPEGTFYLAPKVDSQEHLPTTGGNEDDILSSGFWLLLLGGTLLLVKRRRRTV